MRTPFTPEQFFHVFEQYNTSVFPSQLIIFLLGLVCIFMLHSKLQLKHKLIGAFLALLWLWNGLAYHLAFFTQINPAAYVFAGLFVVQGALIFWETFRKNGLVFNFNFYTKDYWGYLLIWFGLLIYPIINYFTGGGEFSRIIALGLPCPSTILTFGFFMLVSKKFPRYLLIIPSLWAIIGLSAVFNFGVYPDLILFLSAIVADSLLLSKKVRMQGQQT